MLQSRGSQRVGHNLATKQQQSELWGKKNFGEKKVGEVCSTYGQDPVNTGHRTK